MTAFVRSSSDGRASVNLCQSFVTDHSCESGVVALTGRVWNQSSMKPSKSGQVVSAGSQGWSGGGCG